MRFVRYNTSGRSECFYNVSGLDKIQDKNIEVTRSLSQHLRQQKRSKNFFQKKIT